jgi:hypothetical protein
MWECTPSPAVVFAFVVACSLPLPSFPFTVFTTKKFPKKIHIELSTTM